MRLSTALTLALTALLVISLVGAVTATPPTATSSAGDESPTQLSSHALSQPLVQSTQTATPKQIIRISMTDRGDAEWTIESRFLLTDDEDVNSFQEYAENVTSGDRDPDRTIEEFKRAKGDVQEATGREMSIEDGGWDEPRLEQPGEEELEDIEDDDAEIGVIGYTFTWTNFGVVDGNRIYVHDVFQNDRTNPLPSLTSGQRLIIESPPNYEGATPGDDDGTYVWNGPYVFEDEPDLVFLSNGSGLLSIGWIGGSLIAFAFLFGTGGYLLAQRREEYDWLPDRLPPVPFPATDAEVSDPDDGSSNRSASPPVESQTTAPDADTVAFEDGDEIDPSLLSDEERVHRMLNKNGGRMKQASIVKETGWSNAKVSQLLSKMDDNGEIEKLRIGRENLITLPDVDPTEVD